MSRLRRTVVWTASILLTIPVILILIIAVVSRSRPELEPWHTARLTTELSAGDMKKIRDLDSYLNIERRLFAELEREVYDEVSAADRFTYHRYSRDSLSDPRRFSTNWNQTQAHTPVESRGAVLLLHGLTDSPYSMRAVAEIYRQHLFHSICLRLPGHGTTPGSMRRAKWQDWRAAVRVAAHHLDGKISPDQPFHVVGYSNGALLTLLYALESLDDSESRIPDRLVLLSPAIGVSRLAALARWVELPAALPGFEQSRWQTIELEFDPFKYNSFPYAAARQTRELSLEVERRLARLERAGEMRRLPPTTTFQSVVDATVVADDVVSRLYDRVDNPESELVLFDVNRASWLRHFVRPALENRLATLRDAPSIPYRLTLVTNSNPEVTSVAAYTRASRTGFEAPRPLGLSWPKGVYSLSHVALPFPPSDPLYGDGTHPGADDALPLGSLNMRGERGVLRISPGQIIRLRHNPFFKYVGERIEQRITAGGSHPRPQDALGTTDRRIGSE